MTHNYPILQLATAFILISLMINPCNSLSIKLTMDTTSSDTTIPTYNTNIGDCSCNTHQSSCDIFCCCDTTCSTSQISTWNTNSECINTVSNIQRSCDQLSSGGFLSFEDLACVYYSNRGNISYFYSYPDSGSINYPTSNKLQFIVINKSVSVASNSTAISAITTTATANDAYSASQYLLKSSNGATLKYFEVWAPVAGGTCDVGYVNISQSQTYSCSYALNPTTCVSNSAIFNGTIKFCQTGTCSSTTTFPTLTSSTTDNTTCFNMITQQSITITLSSSGSTYTIDSITAIFTKSNISLSNTNYQIKTTINVVTNPSTTVSYSGNPGYLMNKQVNMVNSAGAYKLYNLADASGNCVTTASSTVDLLFGQNAIYSCISSNPCASSLYIDQIAKQTTLNFTKWAKASTDMIQLTGTNASLNTCSQQTIVIDILYTNAGWVADMQNYILGAKISTRTSTQNTWNRKYLKINWVFVDPATISTPPTNYFYSYFSYLWKPLREYFGVY